MRKFHLILCKIRGAAGVREYNLRLSFNKLKPKDQHRRVYKTIKFHTLHTHFLLPGSKVNNQQIFTGLSLHTDDTLFLCGKLEEAVSTFKRIYFISCIRQETQKSML